VFSSFKASAAQVPLEPGPTDAVRHLPNAACCSAVSESAGFGFGVAVVVVFVGDGVAVEVAAVGVGVVCVGDAVVGLMLGASEGLGEVTVTVTEVGVDVGTAVEVDAWVGGDTAQPLNAIAATTGQASIVAQPRFAVVGASTVLIHLPRGAMRWRWAATLLARVTQQPEKSRTGSAPAVERGGPPPRAQRGVH